MQNSAIPVQSATNGELDTTRTGRRLTSWFRRHRSLTLIAINRMTMAALTGIFEGGLRVVSPTGLEYRMEFLAHGGLPEDFGTGRAWKMVRNDNHFVSFVPNSQLDVTHAEYWNRVTIDEFGGRQVLNRSGSTELLPFIGDSFTFGIGVDDGETFVDHLQAALDWRVLNLGIPGSSLPQHRFVMQRRHKELGCPALYAVFFFLGNDFADILDYRRSHTEHTTQIREKESGNYGKLTAAVNRYVNESWLRYSYAIQYVRQAAMHATDERRMNPVFMMMDRSNKRYCQETEDALRYEVELLKAFGRENEFVFVLIPDCYQVVPERRRRLGQYYGLDETTLDPLLPNRTAGQVMQDAGMQVIDPTALIMEHPDTESLYYVNDNHFAARGHALFAESIREELTGAVRNSKHFN
jgi:hypothetical protein